MMWTMMKVATWLLLWIGSGTWLGMDGPVLRISARNEVERKLLCDVFQAAEAIRKHANVTPDIKDAIKVAVYGSASGAQFTEDGKLSPGNRFFSGTQYGRKPVCEYYNQAPFGANQVNGAFAESLFGTFVCVCTPALTGRHETLCGVHYKDQQRTWLGDFNGGRIDGALLQGVWQKVIQKCTVAVKNPEDDINRFGNLARALRAVRDGLRWRRANGGHVHVLGDAREISGCSGRAGNDVCAAYQYEAWKRGVPWVQSLWRVLHQMYAQYEQAMGARRVVSVPVPQPNPETSGTLSSLQPSNAPREVIVDDDGHTIILEDDDLPAHLANTTDAEWGSETTDSSSTAKPVGEAPTRKEGTPSSAETDIAHFATNISDDGLPITEPCPWLLLAASLLA